MPRLLRKDFPASGRDRRASANPLKRNKNAQDEDQERAKKRFRFTATGKVKHGVVGKRHGMSKRGNRFLRQQTGMTLVSEPDTRIIKRNFFPYER